jgi:hypothetical protein
MSGGDHDLPSELNKRTLASDALDHFAVDGAIPLGLCAVIGAAREANLFRLGYLIDDGPGARTHSSSVLLTSLIVCHT